MQKRVARIEYHLEDSDPTQPTSVRPSGDWTRPRRHHWHCRSINRLWETITSAGSTGSQRDPGGFDSCPDHKPTGLPDYCERGHTNSILQDHGTETSQQFTADDQPPTHLDLTISRWNRCSFESNLPGSSRTIRQTVVFHPWDMRWPSTLNKIGRRIFDGIINLREEEKLDPTASEEQWQEFWAKFQWEQSILNIDEKQTIEALLVKYHDIFARHRLDIGINTEFKIQLTPKHDELVNAQGLSTPTNLKDDLLVEMALMQEYGIITILPYNKYSAPIFAQGKPNGKLRILVDLRRINHLLKNDYNQQNHLVTTMADAAQHMDGKHRFCKLDCSQAFLCLQMADEQSVHLPAFNIGSRTFAFLRLAQGLNRSLSVFNSTVREF